MTDAHAAEEARLQQLAHEYESLGYEVTLRPDPSPFRLPEDCEPDLVAIGPTDRVVVEVKSRGSLLDCRDVEILATFVEDQPEWRLELVAVNPAPPPAVEDAPTPQGLIEARAREASELAEGGHHEAALLLAWSALEAALRELAARELGGPRRDVRAKALYALALLTDRQYELVDAVGRIRRRVAHGYEAPALDASLVERAADLARTLSDPGRPTASDMVDWFLGPDEAGAGRDATAPDAVRRILAERFPDADDHDLDEAVHQIRSEITEPPPVT